MQGILLKERKRTPQVKSGETEIKTLEDEGINFDIGPDERRTVVTLMVSSLISQTFFRDRLTQIKIKSNSKMKTAGLNCQIVGRNASLDSCKGKQHSLLVRHPHPWLVYIMTGNRSISVEKLLQLATR